MLQSELPYVLAKLVSASIRLLRTIKVPGSLLLLNLRILLHRLNLSQTSHWTTDSRKDVLVMSGSFLASAVQ